MKKISFAILFSLFNVITFAQSLKVIIKQDGQEIKPVNNVYTLKKSTFQFDISSNNLEGFLIGATTDKGIYSAALGAYNPEVLWFQSTGMAEEFYNKDKEMFLADEAPSYWCFTNAKDHRFDKNPKGNARQWTATRTITRFYDIIKDRAINLKDFKGNVYVLMYEGVYDDEYELKEKKNLFQAELKFVN